MGDRKAPNGAPPGWDADTYRAFVEDGTYPQIAKPGGLTRNADPYSQSHRPAISRRPAAEHHDCVALGATRCTHPHQLDTWYHGALSKWRWDPAGAHQREPLVLAAWHAEQQLLAGDPEPDGLRIECERR